VKIPQDGNRTNVYGHVVTVHGRNNTVVHPLHVTTQNHKQLTNIFLGVTFVLLVLVVLVTFVLLVLVVFSLSILLKVVVVRVYRVYRV
jgi:hypothetical protein